MAAEGMWKQTQESKGKNIRFTRIHAKPQRGRRKRRRRRRPQGGGARLCAAPATTVRKGPAASLLSAPPLPPQRIAGARHSPADAKSQRHSPSLGIEPLKGSGRGSGQRGPRRRCRSNARESKVAGRAPRRKSLRRSTALRKPQPAEWGLRCNRRVRSWARVLCPTKLGHCWDPPQSPCNT